MCAGPLSLRERPTCGRRPGRGRRRCPELSPLAVSRGGIRARKRFPWKSSSKAPGRAILFGLVGEAVLAVALVRTGRGVLLWAMAGVLAVSLGGVAVARFVVTEKKLAAAVIYDCAAAAQKNDLEGVLRHISPEDESLRTQISGIMNLFEISEVKIRALEITVNRLTTPRTATATFNYIGTGKDRRGEYGGQMTYPGKASVRMRREPNGWIIYEHTLFSDPR